MEITTEIEIQSTAERIWSILTDFDAYPDWNPFVQSIEGVLQTGQNLTVSVQPVGSKAMTFRPTVLAAEPNKELRWLGHLCLPGIFDGEHYFRIEPAGPDKVRFIHGEKFSGVMLALMKSALEGTKAGFEAMNKALKSHAESLHFDDDNAPLITEVYQPRPIRFLQLWQIGDWQLKAYGISASEHRVSQALIAAAYELTKERLQQSAEQTRHYGVGFVGIHEGKTANFVFIDWWADENELHHHVYVSPLDQPEALNYKTPSGLAACTWDLNLINHERDAWVEHVLQPEEPDLDGYLQAQLNADI